MHGACIGTGIQCGCMNCEVYQTGTEYRGTVGASGLERIFIHHSLLGPEVPSSLASFYLLCRPSKLLEWALWNGTKRRGKCSCDVGVVVPFNALAMATGQRAGKNAPLLFGQRREERGSWRGRDS